MGKISCGSIQELTFFYSEQARSVSLYRPYLPAAKLPLPQPGQGTFYF